MTAITHYQQWLTELSYRFRSLPFYLVAVLLHLLFLLIFGTYELSPAGGPPVITQFTAPEQRPDIPAAPPPPPPPSSSEQRKDLTAPLPAASKVAMISVAGHANAAFYTKPVTEISPTAIRQADKSASVEVKSRLSSADVGGANLPAVKLRQVLTRAYNFVRDGTGVSGTGKATRAEFQCYWAIYQYGDWNCNPASLSNLTMQVSRWSNRRIRQKIDPKPIVVSSKDLFTIKPPFIYVTGHKDFKFTDQEVDNLQQYLHAGGAIWADNSLPGRRSRFDMAFRREMKRVLTDKDFEPLPDIHPIMMSWFTIRELPASMNFYREPIEIIRLIADEIAIVYTLNAYGDLWESALDENDRIDRQLYRLGPRQGYHKWGPHYGSYYTATHYRNVNDDSVLNAYKLGINIVVHLLNRYENRLRAMGIRPGS
ncbi:MAG: DUF4159 domain-containing protein [Verrucomicrobia bacterium]|nr:DUF4159 domain-containing protein [Verrucomicrobiota bacterium]